MFANDALSVIAAQPLPSYYSQGQMPGSASHSVGVGPPAGTVPHQRGPGTMTPYPWLPNSQPIATHTAVSGAAHPANQTPTDHPHDTAGTAMPSGAAQPDPDTQICPWCNRRKGPGAERCRPGPTCSRGRRGNVHSMLHEPGPGTVGQDVSELRNSWALSKHRRL